MKEEWPTFGDNHPWPRELLRNIIEANPKANQDKVIDVFHQKLRKRKDFLHAVIEEYVGRHIDTIRRSVVGRDAPMLPMTLGRARPLLAREESKKKSRRERLKRDREGGGVAAAK